MAQKIRIAIVEDERDVALELKELLNAEPDFSCQQVYYNAEDALTFLKHAPVDIVLLDIGLPGMTGIELMTKLYGDFPDMQYCMFTVFQTDDKIFESVKAGAKGYILKHEDPEKIIQSLRELHFGGSPMSSGIARKVLELFRTGRTKSIELDLTSREGELLELLSQGLFYKEIASQLELTLGTVKQHIHNIYAKLQVNNRTEAINKYLKR